MRDMFNAHLPRWWKVYRYMYHVMYVHGDIGDGFNFSAFTAGEMIQCDEYIFASSWFNHQRYVYIYLHVYIYICIYICIQ